LLNPIEALTAEIRQNPFFLDKQQQFLKLKAQIIAKQRRELKIQTEIIAAFPDQIRHQVRDFNQSSHMPSFLRLPAKRIVPVTHDPS
jgi:hypothetical protein